MCVHRRLPTAVGSPVRRCGSPRRNSVTMHATRSRPGEPAGPPTSLTPESPLSVIQTTTHAPTHVRVKAAGTSPAERLFNADGQVAAVPERPLRGAQFSSARRPLHLAGTSRDKCQRSNVRSLMSIAPQPQCLAPVHGTSTAGLRAGGREEALRAQEGISGDDGRRDGGRLQRLRKQRQLRLWQLHRSSLEIIERLAVLVGGGVGLFRSRRCTHLV
jgi:hypothetical protein